jgi:proteasome lid subunit RPN8/RPN11
MIVVCELSVPLAAPGIVVPTLYIETAAWAKILGYARLSGTREINGFGYITTDGVDYSIDTDEDVFITKQEVSAGAAEVAASDFARAVDHAMIDGRQDDLRFQWHSHVDGQAYFSSIDTRNIEDYGRAGMEHFISLVMNKKGDLSARLDVFRPVRVSVALRVALFDGSIAQTELQQDIATNVTVRSIVRFAPSAPKKPARRSRAASQPVAVPAGS